MKKDAIRKFFKQYDDKTQEIVDAVLGIEQEYISYQLKDNPKQVQEIRQSIKKYIDRMQKKDEA